MDIGSPLLEMLNNIEEDRYVRRNSAWALGEIANPANIPDLLKNLTTHSTPVVVRRACVRAIGKMQPDIYDYDPVGTGRYPTNAYKKLDEARESLRNIMFNPYEDRIVLINTAWALGELGWPGKANTDNTLEALSDAAKRKHVKYFEDLLEADPQHPILIDEAGTPKTPEAIALQSLTKIREQLTVREHLMESHEDEGVNPADERSIEYRARTNPFTNQVYRINDEHRVLLENLQIIGGMASKPVPTTYSSNTILCKENYEHCGSLEQLLDSSVGRRFLNVLDRPDAEYASATRENVASHILELIRRIRNLAMDLKLLVNSYAEIDLMISQLNDAKSGKEQFESMDPDNRDMIDRVLYSLIEVSWDIRWLYEYTQEANYEKLLEIFDLSLAAMNTIVEDAVDSPETNIPYLQRQMRILEHGKESLLWLRDEANLLERAEEMKVAIASLENLDHQAVRIGATNAMGKIYRAMYVNFKQLVDKYIGTFASINKIARIENNMKHFEALEELRQPHQERLKQAEREAAKIEQEATLYSTSLEDQVDQLVDRTLQSFLDINALFPNHDQFEFYPEGFDISHVNELEEVVNTTVTDIFKTLREELKGFNSEGNLSSLKSQLEGTVSGYQIPESKFSEARTKINEAWNQFTQKLTQANETSDGISTDFGPVYRSLRDMLESTSDQLTDQLYASTAQVIEQTATLRSSEIRQAAADQNQEEINEVLDQLGPLVAQEAFESFKQISENEKRVKQIRDQIDSGAVSSEARSNLEYYESALVTGYQNLLRLSNRLGVLEQVWLDISILHYILMQDENQQLREYITPFVMAAFGDSEQLGVNLQRLKDLMDSLNTDLKTFIMAYMRFYFEYNGKIASFQEYPTDILLGYEDDRLDTLVPEYDTPLVRTKPVFNPILVDSQMFRNIFRTYRFKDNFQSDQQYKQYKNLFGIRITEAKDDDPAVAMDVKNIEFPYGIQMEQSKIDDSVGIMKDFCKGYNTIIRHIISDTPGQYISLVSRLERLANIFRNAIHPLDKLIEDTENQSKTAHYFRDTLKNLISIIPEFKKTFETLQYQLAYLQSRSDIIQTYTGHETLETILQDGADNYRVRTVAARTLLTLNDPQNNKDFLDAYKTEFSVDLFDKQTLTPYINMRRQLLRFIEQRYFRSSPNTNQVDWKTDLDSYDQVLVDTLQLQIPEEYKNNVEITRRILELKRLAIRNLGKLKSIAVVDELIRILLRRDNQGRITPFNGDYEIDQEWNYLRSFAAQALREIEFDTGYNRLIPALLEIAKRPSQDDHYTMRMFAFRMIARLFDYRPDSLFSEDAVPDDWHLREEAMEKISNENCWQTYRYVKQRAANQGEKWAVRLEAIDAYGKILNHPYFKSFQDPDDFFSREVDHFIEIIRTGDDERTETTAMLALSNLRLDNPDIICEKLVTLIQEGGVGRGTTDLIMKTFTRLRCESAIPFLEQLARYSPSREIRRLANDTLDTIRYEQ